MGCFVEMTVTSTRKVCNIPTEALQNTCLQQQLLDAQPKRFTPSPRTPTQPDQRKPMPGGRAVPGGRRRLTGGHAQREGRATRRRSLPPDSRSIFPVKLIYVLYAKFVLDGGSMLHGRKQVKNDPFSSARHESSVKSRP